VSHELLLPIIVALITGPGGWGALQLWLNNKQKKDQATKDREHEDSRTWYRESRHHYDIANEEASKARAECNECRHELEKTRSVVYMLLEDFEDQILPMFTLPDTDPVEVRKASRAIIKRARDTLNASPR
jgi:hypothetical protein